MGADEVVRKENILKHHIYTEAPFLKLQEQSMILFSNNLAIVFSNLKDVPTERLQKKTFSYYNTLYLIHYKGHKCCALHILPYAEILVVLHTNSKLLMVSLRQAWRSRQDTTTVCIYMSLNLQYGIIHVNWMFGRYPTCII